MKYKMLREILEVVMAMQPTGNENETVLDNLEKRLKEGFEDKILTSKQRRVLNCVSKICSEKRKGITEYPASNLTGVSACTNLSACPTVCANSRINV